MCNLENAIGLIVTITKLFCIGQVINNFVGQLW